MFWQRTSRLPVGTVATDAMVLPGETLRASEFYNDWSRPQGYLSVMGATLLVEDGWRVEFVVPGKREFGPEHLKLYQALAPHLTRAVQLTQRLGRTDMERAVAADALDRLSQALLVVDAKSRVLFANRAADALFGNGLSLHDGVLAGRGQWRDRGASSRGWRLCAEVTCPAPAAISPFPAARIGRRCHCW